MNKLIYVIVLLEIISTILSVSSFQFFALIHTFIELRLVVTPVDYFVLTITTLFLFGLLFCSLQVFCFHGVLFPL